MTSAAPMDDEDMTGVYLLQHAGHLVSVSGVTSPDAWFLGNDASVSNLCWTAEQMEDKMSFVNWLKAEGLTMAVEIIGEGEDQEIQVVLKRGDSETLTIDELEGEVRIVF